MSMSLAMMSMMSETDFSKEKPRDYTPTKKKLKEVIPKNMKWFLFRKDGTFKDYEKDGSILREEVYFRCYAINSKNAIKKFNKFKNTE